MYYLLGASELAFAVLCYYGRALTDARARQVVVFTCIVFHAASGVAGVLAVVQGVSGAVWWNVGIRVLMVGLFIFYGLRSSTAAKGA